MEIQSGEFYKIQGIEYIVLATYEKYAMLINNSDSEVNGSGNIIIIEKLDNMNAKVVKDKVTITYVIQQILKNSD